MIPFELKGIPEFLSRDAVRRNHLPQQLKHTVKEGLALKLKNLSFIKSSPNLGNFTRCNFVKFNHIMLKRIVCISLAVLSALPLAAQGDMGEAAPADSLYEFRFKSGDDRFFGVFKENEAQLKALFEFVDCHRPAIEAGTMPLYVDGYCRSMGTDEENLRTAKIRASRVKSELIVRKQLTENRFITKAHASDGEFVTVRIVVTARDASPAGKVAAVETEAMPVTGTNPDNGGTALPEKAETAETAVATATDASSVSADFKSAENTTAEATPYTFSLRANLLRWATLTPDFGVEWRVSRHVGILVNGSWTSWSWDNKNRRYALWEIAPEVRYYIGKEKRGYLGVIYKAGEFNYKFSQTGKQGDLMGGGITGGYQLKLNRALALDFSLGIGCIHADYDKYEVIDGVRVRQGSGTKNWWGPVSAGVTLMWKLF